LGKPINSSNFYHREFRVLLQKSQFKDQGFTFHSLRHTFATELFRSRMHLKVVQSLLGHSSITQTMDRYSHLLEGIGGDAVEGLDDSFG
jgi:integrase